jgi:cytochrome d ubiquinol oxidase subunit I
MAIVFNPSFPFRLTRNVNAFYITTAFVMMGVGAYLPRRERSVAAAKIMISMALDLLIIIRPTT